MAQFILALGLYTAEEMAKDGFEAYWLGSTRVIPDKGDLRDYWTKIVSDMDFLGAAPSYIYIRDPIRRLCHSLISYSISGKGQAPEKYLFRHAKGRKSRARMSRGHFIGRLADHFGLVSDEGLMGLFVISRVLLVASGPERQPDAAASASEIAKGSLAIDEGLRLFRHLYRHLSHFLLQPRLRPYPQRITRLNVEVRKLRQSILCLRRVFDRSNPDQSRCPTRDVLDVGLVMPAPLQPPAARPMISLPHTF
ncbi:hypothetical protein Tco_0255631 [Tanacetum coccineum]